MSLRSLFVYKQNINTNSRFQFQYQTWIETWIRIWKKESNLKLLGYSIFGNDNDNDEIDEFLKALNANRKNKSTKFSWGVFQKYLDKKEIPEKVVPTVLDTISNWKKRRWWIRTWFDDLYYKTKKSRKAEKVLAAKWKSLVKKGPGNKPNATRELCKEEIKNPF